MTAIDFFLVGNVTEGDFFAVACDAMVPGGGDSVTVVIEGPAGEYQGSSGRGNDVYRGVVSFFELTQSDSGTYTCNATRSGRVAASAAFAIDVNGK